VVFYLIVVVNCCGALVFGAFASGELQFGPASSEDVVLTTPAALHNESVSEAEMSLDVEDVL
jgi:hypothetical protein